jgi:hypothetical protein
VAGDPRRAWSAASHRFQTATVVKCRTFSGASHIAASDEAIAAPRSQGNDELRQIADQTPRDTKIRRFGSFREPIIDRGECVAGLVALSVFG